MRSDLVLVLLLAALATVRPGPTTFVNGTDYPLDLRTSPAPDTTWTHVSAGARARAWQQLPETLFINRDSISADPLMYLFASVPARAKAAGFVLNVRHKLVFHPIGYAAFADRHARTRLFQTFCISSFSFGLGSSLAAV